jgi:putative FmdB family regulatory protein
VLKAAPQATEGEIVPTYEYTCTECGEQVEVVQKFTDDPLTVCTACGGRLRKVFSPVGIVFKGSGFYRTDSRKGSSGDAPGQKDKDKEPAAAKADSKSGSSADSGSPGSSGSGSSDSSSSSKSSTSSDSGSSSSGSSSSGSSAGSGDKKGTKSSASAASS